ncbi:MAG: helix-turn-helix domain-containing protein [Burkholderiales bacterium]|nr:helix-turn-helix domain-containing protein [Burkholderiales bacterium]
MSTPAIALKVPALRRTAAASANPARREGGSIGPAKAQCSACNLRELCLPCGLNAADMAAFSDAIYTRKRIGRGETLLRSGQEFESVYAVRAGFFKSSVVLEDGREQVTGFHMAGDIVGMDGIGTESHTTDVAALEDSEVCIIPYARLQEAGMQRQLHKAMSRELVRGQGVMMLLGTMRAEERLAAFLLNLSQRFGARGFSPSEFRLRMTRAEIGSHVGLALETVSRLFSRFESDGLITARQKDIRIHDIPGLKALVLQVTTRTSHAGYL